MALTKMRIAYVCVYLGLALSVRAPAQSGASRPPTQASEAKAMKKAARQQHKDQSKNAKAQQKALKRYKKIHGIG